MWRQVETTKAPVVVLPTAKALRKLESIAPRRTPPFDDVQLGAFIGRGGGGSVFAAHRNGLPVAVKVLCLQ